MMMETFTRCNNDLTVVELKHGTVLQMQACPAFNLAKKGCKYGAVKDFQVLYSLNNFLDKKCTFLE